MKRSVKKCISIIMCIFLVALSAWSKNTGRASAKSSDRKDVPSNGMYWSEPAMLASHVTTNNANVLELTKYLLGIGRYNLRAGLNRNLQFAMYLFEGLRLSDIKCRPDASSPYSSSHLDSELMDSVQFPEQTLRTGAGDIDEIGVLFMSMLASSGFSVGFVPLSDDFIVMFDLRLAESEIPVMFNDCDHVIVMKGRTLVPLSMSSLDKGFISSWYGALKKLNGSGYECFMIDDAWYDYPPHDGIFRYDANYSRRPNEESVVAAVESDMSEYIAVEFIPKINAAKKKLAANRNDVGLLNQLALIYSRVGMYADAIPVYEQAAAMGSVSAMNNLGNIAMLQKRFGDARIWYERVLNVEPDNRTALSGLEHASVRLEE